MKLTIDRSRWSRGEGAGDGACIRLLRQSDNKMCCLGFFALACGLTEKQILEMGEPQEPLNDHRLPPPAPYAFLVEADPQEDREPIAWDENDEPVFPYEWSPTTTANELMATNDDPMPEDVREQRIASHFARQGVEVEFVDGAPCRERATVKR